MAYRIFLDPGHGGSDRTNKGPTGYVEADGVLDIALRLRSELQDLGFVVGMSRDKDVSVSLSQRGKMAGQFKADLFLSIHSNAGPAAASGTEVYYSVDLPQTKAIAAKMSKAVADVLGIPDRGARVRESQNYKGEDYYTVIDAAQDAGVPRVFLIEVAFHSNPKEEALLKQPNIREKVADVLANVIADAFGIKKADANIPIVPINNRRGIVNVNGNLNVRNGPGEQYAVIGKLQNNDAVTVTGESVGWYRINYNNGVGYVSSRYVVLDNSSNNSNQKEEDDVVDTIIVYYGDIDALAAIVLGQKYKAPVMRKSDFDASGIKAKKVIQVGGGEGDRFDTFKRAAQLL
jgi:N-acetylmuramoyl-L-alanine amidase